MANYGECKDALKNGAPTGFCELHGKRLDETGRCSVIRAHFQQGLVCHACGTVMAPVGTKPPGRVFDINHDLVNAFYNKGVVIPKIAISDPLVLTRYNQLVAAAKLPACDECRQLVEPAINVETNRGRVRLKSGEWLPFFVERLTGVTANHKPEPEVVLSPLPATPVVEPEPDATSTERSAEQLRRLLDRLLIGKSRMLFGDTRQGDGTIYAQCAVDRNQRHLCRCGGWHDWRTMPTLPVNNKVTFAVGPACAAVAPEHFREGVYHRDVVMAMKHNEYGPDWTPPVPAPAAPTPTMVITGPVGLVRRLMEGRGRFEYGGTRGVFPDIERQCAVYVNDLPSCECGGWHDPSRMVALAFQRDDRIRVFALGAQCALAVARLMEEAPLRHDLPAAIEAARDGRLLSRVATVESIEAMLAPKGKKQVQAILTPAEQEARRLANLEANRLAKLERSRKKQPVPAANKKNKGGKNKKNGDAQADGQSKNKKRGRG